MNIAVRTWWGYTHIRSIGRALSILLAKLNRKLILSRLLSNIKILYCKLIKLSWHIGRRKLKISPDKSIVFAVYGFCRSIRRIWSLQHRMYHNSRRITFPQIDLLVINCVLAYSGRCLLRTTYLVKLEPTLWFTRPQPFRPQRESKYPYDMQLVNKAENKSSTFTMPIILLAQILRDYILFSVEGYWCSFLMHYYDPSIYAPLWFTADRSSRSQLTNNNCYFGEARTFNSSMPKRLSGNGNQLVSYAVSLTDRCNTFLPLFFQENCLSKTKKESWTLFLPKQKSAPPLRYNQ